MFAMRFNNEAYGTKSLTGDVIKDLWISKVFLSYAFCHTPHFRIPLFALYKYIKAARLVKHGISAQIIFSSRLTAFT